MNKKYESVARAIVRNEPAFAREAIGLTGSSSPAVRLKGIAMRLKLKDWPPEDLELLMDALSWDSEAD